jgi:hypothetical protein
MEQIFVGSEFIFNDKRNGNFKHYRITAIGKKNRYGEDIFDTELIAVNDEPLARILNGAVWTYDWALSDRISFINNK